MKLFRIVGGEVELEKDDDIFLIPEFRKIIRKDRGSDGDVAGRFKKFATKEFTYIYFVADEGAYPAANGLNEKETHDFAVRNSGLEQGYKPDEFVKAAIEKYRELRPSPSAKILKTTKRALNVANESIEKLIERLRHNLDKVNSMALSDSLDEETEENLNKLIDKNSNDLKRLLSLSTELPTTLSTIETLEIQVKKELSEGETTRGGHKKPNRADPK